MSATCAFGRSETYKIPSPRRSTRRSCPWRSGSIRRGSRRSLLAVRAVRQHPIAAGSAEAVPRGPNLPISPRRHGAHGETQGPLLTPCSLCLRGAILRVRSHRISSFPLGTTEVVPTNPRPPPGTTEVATANPGPRVPTSSHEFPRATVKQAAFPLDTTSSLLYTDCSCNCSQ